jgi:hypothetical protein
MSKDTILNEESEFKELEVIEKKNYKKVIGNTKDPLENDSEAPISVCEWSSYNGKRCSRKSNGSHLCQKHAVLIKDFKIIDKKDFRNKECLTATEIKVVPMSYIHVKNMQEKYDHSGMNIDVHFPGGHVEECNISNEDYIETPDGTQYFYESNSFSKGKQKAKNIKIHFTKFCNNKPIVSYYDDIYCKECYKNVSKKLGYPRISILENWSSEILKMYDT